ncbi:hypothetical protein SAMN05421639_101967 [Chryseobacterium shigense]|uniref:Uncharacterized protein n=1 Tax=Chryseobacterium shigense TaxID=297244 RepID=A0A1N7I0J2_9FLAO|nr:hypothetical protein [Chryseobacterium shigense]SIS30587.1 hypothetical protein SAMN05421639_101967 [Chryseobacterium shigense]
MTALFISSHHSGYIAAHILFTADQYIISKTMQPSPAHIGDGFL